MKQNALHSGYMTLVKSKIMRRKVYMSLTEKGLEMSKRRDGPVEGTSHRILRFDFNWVIFSDIIVSNLNFNCKYS